MEKATVKNITLDRSNDKEIIVTIQAEDSVYIEKGQYSSSLMNSGPLVEGINHVLEFGHDAVSAMKRNTEFMDLANDNRILRTRIQDSVLATRIRQFLSALDYENLTDYQAKIVLLIEKELKTQ